MIKEEELTLAKLRDIVVVGLALSLLLTSQVHRGSIAIANEGSFEKEASTGGEMKFTSHEEIKRVWNNSLKNSILETTEQSVARAYGVGARVGTPLKISYEGSLEGNPNAAAWVNITKTSDYPYSASLELAISDMVLYFDSFLWISKERIIAHEMTHAMMSSAGINLTSNGFIPYWFVEGSAEYLAGGNERLLSDLENDGSKNLLKAIDGKQSGSSFYSVGYLATKYLDRTLENNDLNIKDFIQKLAKEQKSFDQTLKEMIGYGETEFMKDFKENGEEFIEGLNLEIGTGSILEKIDNKVYTDETMFADNYNPVDSSDYFEYVWPIIN